MKCFCYLVFLSFLIACSDSKTNTLARVPLIKDSNLFKGQSVNPYEPVDISPMDMSYLPNDYPILKMDNKTVRLPVARIIYSRPQKQGRKIFGSLIKFGDRWRLGANEATEIELFQPVTIQSTNISAGRYVLYCIPQADKWTIIFNGNLDCWGLKQDPKRDIYKFVIPVQQRDQAIEFFTMVFNKTSKGADLVMAWDNIEARLPFQYSEK